MTKQIAKKIILQFHHQQDKLYFYQCKVIFLYDVATQQILSVPGQSKEDAAERLKLYFQDQYEIQPSNFIVRLDQKPTAK